MTHSRYRAVVFDLFGTLVPKWSRTASNANCDEMARILGADGLAFRRAWLASYRERETGLHASLSASLTSVCEQLQIRASASQITAAAESRLALNRERMRPRDDALPTLHAARDRGYKIGLISNAGPSAPELWPGTSLAGLVTEAAFSSVEGAVKPEPVIYERLIARLDVQATHCVYVGDGGGRELSAARSLGMHAVLIHDPDDDGTTGPEDESAHWDGDRVRSLSEVLDRLTGSPWS